MEMPVFSRLNLRPVPALCAFLLLFAVVAASAQTFTVVADFDKASGGNTYVPPTQGLNGDLYGVTSDAGANGDGAVYTITSTGALRVLHNFAGTDGKAPMTPLSRRNSAGMTSRPLDVTVAARFLMLKA